MKVEIGPYPDSPDDEERVINVHIDKYDTWNMDSTLALIILPMLKQLRDTKHGSAMVDLEDIPEEMRVVGFDDLDHTQSNLDFGNKEEYEQLSWKQHEVRWNWVMDEMIWAFEQKTIDWEEQFYSGEVDCDVGEDGMVYGPNHTFKVDYDALQNHHERMKNGFRLFGKYYEGLWD